MVLSAVIKHDAKHLMNNLINTCTHLSFLNLFTVGLTPYILSIRLENLDATELLISNGAKNSHKRRRSTFAFKYY